MQELLFLAHRIPFPPNKGDKLRSYHVLKYLSARHRVHLGCFIDDQDDFQHIDTLKAICGDTCFIALPAWKARLRSVRSLLTGEAQSVPYYRDGRMSAWVDRLLGTGKIPIAVAFSSPMAQYLAPYPALRRVIDFVDVDSEKWRQYGQTKAWPLSQLYRREARYLLAYEREVARQCHSATFVTHAETALFARLAPESRAKLTCIHNGVDSDYFSPHILCPNPYPSRHIQIVFSGAMDYWPNIEAACWFVHEVFVPLRTHNPALQFVVVGRHPTAQVRALARIAGVIVTGSVPDVRPYLAHAALSVAPLRIARGVQNKVLEAMSMQKVVIASPQAFEGISACVGVDIIVADGSDEYIANVAELLTSARKKAIGLAARARVLRDYSWATNLDRLGALLSDPEPLAREHMP